MKKNELDRVHLIEKHMLEITGIKRKAVYPQIVDIHPVMNACNLLCKWCIGGESRGEIFFLSKEQSRMCMQKIFREEKRNFWPSEIHICGNNSEPMLNMESIREIVRQAKEKSVRTIIVSNGMLINKETVEVLQDIDVVNISLDAVNNKDYIEKKCNNKKYERPYDLVLSNLKLLIETVKKNKKKCTVCVSFVIEDVEELDNNFSRCISQLEMIGVDIVKIRYEIKKKYSRKQYVALKEYVNDLNCSFKMINVVSNISKALEYEETFDICYGPFVWPALEANMKVYPCAHCSNQRFEALFDLGEIDYYDFYDNNEKTYLASDIKCNRICPPLLGAVNSRYIES